MYQFLCHFPNSPTSPLSGRWKSCCLIACSDLVVISSTQSNQLHVHRLLVAGEKKWESLHVLSDFSCEKIVRFPGRWYEHLPISDYSRLVSEQTVLVRDSALVTSSSDSDLAYVLQICLKSAEIPLESKDPMADYGFSASARASRGSAAGSAVDDSDEEGQLEAALSTQHFECSDINCIQSLPEPRCYRFR